MIFGGQLVTLVGLLDTLILSMALEWYHSDEYKPVKDIRLQNSEGSNIIVKGI